jgi:TPR repeat protein
MADEGQEGEAMKKVVAALLAGWLLVAAAPADEALALMEQGKEAEAFALVERAAAQGDPKSIDYLAWFYDSGRHVAADRAKAGALYRRAADLGVAHAQWRLGVMIDSGEFDGATLEEAVRLFAASAAQDFTNGYVSLAVMQSTGRGTPRDYAAAMDNFRKAARLGNIHAFNEIGVMYYNGEGVPADPQEALAWIMVAGVRGDEAAQSFMLNGFREIDVDVPAAADRAEAIEREFGMDSGEIELEAEDEA